MSKLSVVRRCYNCGAILQSEDEGKEGYIAPELLDGGDELVLFCADCWSRQRYNFAPREPNVPADYLSMLEDAQASDSLIVYVIDLFSFESSFSPSVTRQIEGLNVLVIANKRDLLPAESSDEWLKEYVAHRFRMARLQVKSSDVVLTSLTSTYDLSDISKEIERRRRRHDVYVIGAVGAGKTQLIYSFLRGYSNLSNRNVASVNYPGTKLRVMQIPLDGSTGLFDTPGIPTDNSVLGFLSSEDARKAYPDRAVKKRSVSLSCGESVGVGGVCLLELHKGEKQTLDCYFSQNIDLKRHSAKNMKSFFSSLSSKSSWPTVPSGLDASGFDAFDIQVEEKGGRDIGVEGLGWFAFEGKEQTFRIFVPKGVAVYTTRSKIRPDDKAKKRK